MTSYIKADEKTRIYIDNGAVREAGVAGHKFGRNLSVGTSFVPISIGGIYRTPQPSAATQLRVKAGGDANDTAAGTGAREITLIGLDADGYEITETLATAGISASSSTTKSFMRLYRCFVSASGTYASQTAGSHANSITIENSSGTEDWATIDANGFPRSQSEIAVLSVPKNKVVVIDGLFYGADDKAKVVEIVVFRRENILQTSAPYESMRVIVSLSDTGNTADRNFLPNPLGPYIGPCDVGVMAKIDTGTTEVHIDFQYRIFDVTS